MKNFFKRYYKVLFGMLVGILLSSSMVCFAYCVWAKDVGFGSSTGLVSTNVQDAIDELNKKERQCSTTENIPEGTICIRAKQLHKSNCQSGYLCEQNGDTPTIEWGKLGTKGEEPQFGDAFDCDVNGDKNFDAAKERFYYLGSSNVNSEYANLIYSNNTTVQNGEVVVDSQNPGEPPFNTGNPYESFNGSYYALSYLPSVNLWTNVRLASANRSIYSDVNGGNTISYDYGDRAAKSVSYFDISRCAHGNFDEQNNEVTLGHECLFLLENTKYDGSYSTGYWTEDALGTYNSPISVSYESKLYARTGSYTGYRPVIEVSKSDILY